MIKLYTDKKDCCGCTACKHVCPRGAIMMEPDAEGFLYPRINAELCVECKLCGEVCAFQRGYPSEANWKEPLVFAVKHNSDQVREESASGGMFTAISDYVLQNNGIIYGAGFDKDFVVCHQRACSKEERDMLRGSKYVQSDLQNTFEQVKNDLLQSKIVLFTGTPCQVGGLVNYLKNSDQSKLYLCDLICHGTPSPKLFADYLQFIQILCKSPITKVSLRDKTNGWHDITESYTIDNGNKFFAKYYLELFNRHVALRPSCHHCIYTNLNRPSDITIGDFWGIEKYKPEFDDNKGVSFVLVNTDKGKLLLEGARENVQLIGAKVEYSVQPQLQYPAPSSPIRQRFWDDYKQKGFEYVVKKYTSYGPLVRNKARISKILRRLGWLDWTKNILSAIKRQKR